MSWQCEGTGCGGCSDCQTPEQIRAKTSDQETSLVDRNNVSPGWWRVVLRGADAFVKIGDDRRVCVGPDTYVDISAIDTFVMRVDDVFEEREWLWDQLMTDGDVRPLQRMRDALLAVGVSADVEGIRKLAAASEAVRAVPKGVATSYAVPPAMVWDCRCGQRVEIPEDLSCGACGTMIVDIDEGIELYELRTPLHDQIDALRAVHEDDVRRHEASFDRYMVEIRDIAEECDKREEAATAFERESIKKWLLEHLAEYDRVGYFNIPHFKVEKWTNEIGQGKHAGITLNSSPPFADPVRHEEMLRRLKRSADDIGLIEVPPPQESNIEMLCRLVKESGLTMTLYGVPVNGPDELRRLALDSAADRIATALSSSSTIADRAAVHQAERLISWARRPWSAPWKQDQPKRNRKRT